MIITNIIIYYFPQNQEIVEGLNNALFIKNNLLLNLLIVAAMPAICEEIFFRGFILTSFKNNKKSYRGAIIFSGILFGLMHMDFIRVVPTSILGIAFAYAVCKTNSIAVSMFMHFFNNGFAVVITHISSKVLDNTQTTDMAVLSFNEIGIFLALSFMFIFLATLLFKERKNADKLVE